MRGAPAPRLEPPTRSGPAAARSSTRPGGGRGRGRLGSRHRLSSCCWTA